MAERTDTERLNWLEHSLSSIHCNWTTPDDWTVTIYEYTGAEEGHFHANTLREAIDAAMDKADA